MSMFVIGRNRDAWFVIRGYKYQVDLTILRWLRLTETQSLYLECGEDIDIVNKALVGRADDALRELEQVKHLDAQISLRSPPCKIALANAVGHFTANPSQNLLFRFCTNSTYTTERPTVFDDRRAGIEVWENIRNGAIGEPERSTRLSGLLAFLRGLAKPEKGIDSNTWNGFASFIAKASVDEVANLVSRLEWSTQHQGAAEAPKEILRLLQVGGHARPDAAQFIYPRLFLHVMQILSSPDEKILDQNTLSSITTLPSLAEADAQLLSFITTELIAQSERLEELEVMAKRHEDAISDIRRQMLEVQFGPTMSVNLWTAVADISTSLPPQVGSIARREELVSDMRSRISGHEWFAMYGSIGCGKTQLAALLGAQIDPIVYVSLRDLTSGEANFLLHHLFLQFCGNEPAGPVTNSGLNALEVGTTIFLDDVPQLAAGDPLSQRLLQIANMARERQQTLVTLSHFPVPADVTASLQRGRFTEMVAPRFDADDVKELFTNHGAPQGAISGGVAMSFVDSTSGNPTLLAAVARTLEAKGWQNLEELRAEQAQMAAAGEVLSQAMGRLLATVEEKESRELLYRLCVIIGAFGMQEMNAVALVDPRLARLTESYARLHGLWIEKQTNEHSVVCPLIAQVGANELDAEVKSGVANTLAEVIFKRGALTPIEFAKAINYLKEAENVAQLGMHLLAGLESVADAPQAWRRLVYYTSAAEGLLNGSPTVLALLIKAKQIALAQSIGVPVSSLASEAAELIAKAEKDEMWAVVGYASQAASRVAEEDFDEGLRLCELVLQHFEEVVQLRNKLIGEPADEDEEPLIDMENALPWYFVSQLKTADEFTKWFGMVANQPQQRARAILSHSLAREGLKIAVDRLWMTQHEVPENKRELEPIIAVYEAAAAYFKANGLRLCEAMVVRAKIIVLAEYCKNVQEASEVADAFLSSGENTDEIEFVIGEVIGRQYLYAKQKAPAIEHLKRACALDTGTFDGLRCRAFVELSRAIGDDECGEALSFAEIAVAIAKRNTRDVSDLDMVAALGEAAIAAGFCVDYARCFDYMDEAFVEMKRKFEETVEWKMRFVFLGNALGYFASIASTGKPPATDYTVPPRGHLITYNEMAASWYDEEDYGKFDLAPTLLVHFANAVGRDERAILWANEGIDDARAKGVLICIYPLGEALIPSLVAQEEFDQALDYAYESSIALVASAVAHRAKESGEDRDIRERQDPFTLLGEKPNSDWSQAEEQYLFIGVLPVLLWCCVQRERGEATLPQLASHCRAKSDGASNPEQFVVIADAIESFSANERSRALHANALSEHGRENWAAAATLYLLSSFSKDAVLGEAIIQHALVMEHYAAKITGKSALWKFLTEQLVSFWREAFELERFRFSSPGIVASDLQGLEQVEPEIRVKCLIKIILRGLSVRIPPQIASTAAWLDS